MISEPRLPVSWTDFAASSPELARFGLARMTARPAYFATVKADGSPRVHPVSPFVVGDQLLINMNPDSPKGRDLRRDPRFMLHAGVESDDGGGGEFAINGEARLVEDPAARAAIFEGARALGHHPREIYVIFELRLNSAQSTTYPGDDTIRTKWPSG